jgi:hypothetical protein
MSFHERTQQLKRDIVILVIGFFIAVASVFMPQPYGFIVCFVGVFTMVSPIVKNIVERH